MLKLISGHTYVTPHGQLEFVKHLYASISDHKNNQAVFKMPGSPFGAMWICNIQEVSESPETIILNALKMAGKRK